MNNKIASYPSAQQAVPIATFVSVVPSAPTSDRVSTNVNQRADTFHEGGAREFLTHHKWPVGLQDTFLKNLPTTAFRYFICDDSGSMSLSDGHTPQAYVTPDGLGYKLVGCTRWFELVTSLKFHSKLACATFCPSQFKMLNALPPVTLGDVTRPDGAENMVKFERILQRSPEGGTPLCARINEVVNDIRHREHELRANGQKVLVMIATDGEASDGNVANAMRPFKHLPVWVIVRLCTDEDRIVNYWNSIDKELELNMDVIDDLCGEAKEIYRYNPWLTYGEPLQRLREFGLSVKELDLLDEKKLSLEEVSKVCSYIYGGSPDNYPHPEVDWIGFIAAIDRGNVQLDKVWDPITQKTRHWIDTVALTRTYRKGASCCVVC